MQTTKITDLIDLNKTELTIKDLKRAMEMQSYIEILTDAKERIKYNNKELKRINEENKLLENKIEILKRLIKEYENEN